MIKRFNVFKQINEAIVETPEHTFNYVYYTGGYDLDEIKRTYQVLFDNGYTLGGRNKIENVRIYELGCTLLFINSNNKTILYGDANEYDGGNDSGLIYNLIIRYRMDSEDWYLIKNKQDFNKMFKVQMNIKKYFNSRKNIYESVLDNSEGISKEKNYSNSTLDSLKPKELVDEYIKETKIINKYNYKKIFIFINTLDEFIEVIQYFKKTFNINFISDSDELDIYSNYEENCLMVLHVNNLYDVIEKFNCGEKANIYFFTIFDVISLDKYKNRKDFINFVINNLSRRYFNEKDTINNLSELNRINNLIKYGNSNSFNGIYLNKNKKTYE